MKNFFLLLVFGFTFGYGQGKVELTNVGVSPIVTDVENQTAEQLYLKTKEWIQLNYKNPSEVLKGDIKNEMIRIRAFSQGFLYVKTFVGKTYYDLEYTIEFNFKDNKYKFSFIGDSEVRNKGQKVNFFTLPSALFKSDGKTVKSIYIEGYDSYIQSVNDIYFSHFNYISGKTASSKNDW